MKIIGRLKGEEVVLDYEYLGMADNRCEYAARVMKAGGDGFTVNVDRIIMDHHGEERFGQEVFNFLREAGFCDLRWQA